MASMIPAASGYSLWLRPYGELAYKLKQRIKKYSEEYDTPSFEPHLTLLGGLKQNETSLVSMTKLLAGRLHPFEISLNNISYTENYYRSLFIKADKTDELISAYITARRLFGDESDPSTDDFMPHVSLMYSDLDRNEKLRLINSHGNTFECCFEVHSVMLVKCEGAPQQWEEIHSAQFDKT
jgi:2'-5' RNA ligase